MGAVPALVGISRRGRFFTTVYIKAQPYFEPLFALRHKLLQKFVVLENLQLFFIQKYAILRSEKFYAA